MHAGDPFESGITICETSAKGACNHEEISALDMCRGLGLAVSHGAIPGARLRRKTRGKTIKSRSLFRRLYSRRLGQPLPRFRARSMRSVLLWENPTTAMTQGRHSGRREINWDGGGNNDQTQPLPRTTPFDVFLNTRGGQFTTLGTGLTQAPPSGGPQGGLAGLFNNPTYGDIFSTFSPLRLFTPVGSNLTQASFFVPGTNPTHPPTVSGFGAVFTDVDEPDGIRPVVKQRGSPRGPARGWSTSTSTAS